MSLEVPKVFSEMPKVFGCARGLLRYAQPNVLEGANGFLIDANRFLRDAQPNVFEGANGPLRDAQRF